MPKEVFKNHKPPRFFKYPDQVEIQEKGLAVANVHQRIKARIIGSRVMTATVVLGIGTAISIQEYISNGTIRPVDILANYAIPSAINGLAEIKVEGQLRRTEKDLVEILSNTDKLDILKIEQDLPQSSE